MWYVHQLQNISIHKRKHPFPERPGSVADMMVQFYRAKMVLADKSEEKKEVTDIEIDDDDDQSCEGCCTYSVFYMFVLSCIVCDFRMLHNK